jgi:hypothetical protein
MVKTVFSSTHTEYARTNGQVGSAYQVNAATRVRNLSRFDIIKEAVTAINMSRFDVRARQRSRKSGGVSRVFTLAGKTIYARNVATDVVTKLGFLPEGATTIVDAALADGTYEFEVRTSNAWWQEARSRVRFTAEIVGGVLAFQSIPHIENLRIVITSDFKTQIRWNIPDVVLPATLQFGIWRSATTPVVVTGPPDEIVQAYDGIGAYRKTVTQTASEYFAVAAYTDTDQGLESEVYSPWSLTPPASPSDQYAY